MRMPEAGRVQVCGSSSLDTFARTPEVGDVPGKREICPSMSAYFPRLRGGKGDDQPHEHLGGGWLAGV